MADLLDYYYRDRDALKIDGEWCRSRINEKQFTWPIITKKMLRIVDEVLSAKEEQPEFKGFGTPVKVG
jgi:hypothetical protein